MVRPRKYGRVTEDELVEQTGKSLSTVRNRTASGELVKGPDGLYDLETARGVFARSQPGGRPRKDRSVDDPEPVPKQRKARDWHDVLKREQALKARIERRALQGTLVQRSAVESLWVERASMVRDQLLQLGPRLAGRLASESDPAVCAQVVTDEVRTALRSLSEPAMGSQ